MVTLVGCYEERRAPVYVRNVCVRPLPEQLVDHPCVVLVGSEEEGGRSFLILGIGRGTIFQKGSR